MKTFCFIVVAALGMLRLPLSAESPVPPPASKPVTGGSSAAPKALPDGVLRFGGMTCKIKSGAADPIHRTEKISDTLVAEENGKVSVNGAPAIQLQEGQLMGLDGKLAAGPFDTTAPGILGSPKTPNGNDKDSFSGAPMPKPQDTPKEFRRDSTGNAPATTK